MTKTKQDPAEELDEILGNATEENENDNEKGKPFAFKMTDEVRDKLEWLRNEYRFESMAHTIRIIIADMYERMQKARDATDIRQV